jgi:hypothetical protein
MKLVLRALPVLVALMIGYAPASNAALLFENYAPNPTATEWAARDAGPIFGTEFTVAGQDLLVTKLGTFSTGSPGRQVGIWSSDQTLMRFVTVEAGEATSTQGWNLFDVEPFTLLANTTYRIAARTEAGTLASGGAYDLFKGIASVTPGHVWSNSSGFDYPTLSFSTPFYLAANAEVAAIPEPSSVALLLAGLAGLWFARRRRT